jgi:hypothetical protein
MAKKAIGAVLVFDFKNADFYSTEIVDCLWISPVIRYESLAIIILLAL